MNKRKKPANKRKKTNIRSESRSFIFLLFAFIVLFFFIHWLANSKGFLKKTDKVAKNQEVVKVDEPEEPPIELEKTPENDILECAKKLEVPEKLYRIKKKDNTVNIQIPINPAKLDLYFANYFFTKELTSQGWLLISGEENVSGSTQKLSFKPPNQTDTYIINIYYDKSKSYPIEKPKIAIIITELGDEDFKDLSQYLQIPFHLNYAIIPFRKNTNRIYQQVLISNSEVLINVPMEDINYPKIDHGKYGIEVKFTEKDIINALKEQIKELPEAKGTINYLGSLATTDEQIMHYTMQTLKKHNLYFVDNMTPISSIAFNTAQKNVMSSYKKSLSLDLSSSTINLNTKLNEIVNLGVNQQIIVVTIPYYKLGSYQLFYGLCDLINKQGYEFIKISSLDNILF
ncbi:MAG TPA: divergent polysaccharide deacetylase family protein [Candidatus Cloacimonadota bacterium]|nr:divergent polysaccharide deacetylase family protein [Candidatus Cloacimonadota bacterium]HOQ79947.1 divergent polysaccharide deacetylase family protein [Candidatus Cloacimonadota bacterium]